MSFVTEMEVKVGRDALAKWATDLLRLLICRYQSSDGGQAHQAQSAHLHRPSEHLCEAIAELANSSVGVGTLLFACPVGLTERSIQATRPDVRAVRMKEKALKDLIRRRVRPLLPEARRVFTEGGHFPLLPDPGRT